MLRLDALIKVKSELPRPTDRAVLPILRETLAETKHRSGEVAEVRGHSQSFATFAECGMSPDHTSIFVTLSDMLLTFLPSIYRLEVMHKTSAHFAKLMGRSGDELAEGEATVLTIVVSCRR